MNNATGVNMLSSQPIHPKVGDAYYDAQDRALRIYGADGKWSILAAHTKNRPAPTRAPLTCLNTDTNEFELFDQSLHIYYEDENGMPFIKFRLSALDRSMIAFEKKVNNHPDMNVKMVWHVDRNNKDKNGRQIVMRVDNDPNYWLGVAYGAYMKKVIDQSELTDVLLALQATGIKSSYFNEITGKLGRGEL
jgi:hypothetical protein